MLNLFRDHLKHLIFNDAMVTHRAGCNHSAVDRSLVRSAFIDDIQKQDFIATYEEVYKKYMKEREEFDPHPIRKYFDTAQDGTKVVVTEQGGYWKDLNEVDLYVNKFATQKMVDFLLKIHQE